MSSVPVQRKNAKGAAKQQQQQQSQAAAKADEAMTAKAEGPYTDRMLQGAIFVAVAVPWLILVALEKQSPQELAQNLVKDLHIKQAMNERGFLDDPRFWYIVAALSTPHVFYFIVWTNASIFYRLVKPIGEPFQVFALMAHGIKAFQACALAVWYFGLDYWLSTDNLVELPHEALTFLGSRSTAQLILAGELFMLGQLFNGGVYQSIGEAGVYYGCRLGQTVPWVFGFPFSVVPHPQYLGATVSIWGGVLLCATSASVSAGIYAIGVIMTVFYFFSSMVEQHL
ncbi:Phosphatidyl-N-methylethanolamine N-methyltransferase [Hondaea fermentalgiana]|uniref:phosphatidyl-N-methylethanolamine N-methyltransferase n=1 Tax=Hondaea fermentalgiana TaxID=2315210 RepID=A0A2R5GJL5_9STRA|nr:Phosphatidyl-N-methylethanolamine N-methyltransferase [Hondaea fermentalgiana]|eukprot:GBG30815.1 Phosphatidyl-N-methylethanolamine N-methyltransferase [Hondaea fermentalgiana]